MFEIHACAMTDAEKWRCFVCGFGNDAQSVLCAYCTMKRPESHKDDGHSDGFEMKDDTQLTKIENNDDLSKSDDIPSREEIELICNDIATYTEHPERVYHTLRSVARKLRKPDVRYRTLDTTGPKVVERLLGFDGVIDFLSLLGFESDALNIKLIVKKQQPSAKIELFIDVLTDYNIKFEHKNWYKRISGDDGDVDDLDVFDDDNNGFECRELIRRIIYSQMNLYKKINLRSHSNINTNDVKEQDTTKDNKTKRTKKIESDGTDLDSEKRMKIILLTHRMFMDSTQFFDTLIDLFWHPDIKSIITNQLVNRLNQLLKLKNNSSKDNWWRQRIGTNDTGVGNVRVPPDVQGLTQEFRLEIIRWLQYWIKQFWVDDFIRLPNTKASVKKSKILENRFALRSKLKSFIISLQDEDNATKFDAPYLSNFANDLQTTYSTIVQEYKPKKYESLNDKVVFDRIRWDGDETWKRERQVWIAFHKNNENGQCYFALLPKDIIKHILSFTEKGIYLVCTNASTIKLIQLCGEKYNHKILNYLYEPDWNTVDYSQYVKNIFDLSDYDIANQITLITYRLFMKIDKKEYINQEQKYENEYDKQLLTQNLCQWIDHFNSITKFIQTEILNEKSSHARSKCIERCIKLCEMLTQLGNYFASRAVLTALESSAIHVVRVAWENVKKNKTHNDMFENLKKLFDRDLNSRNIRNAIRKQYFKIRSSIGGDKSHDENDKSEMGKLWDINGNGGIIPSIGCFLRDLGCIQDGCKHNNLNDQQIDLYRCTRMFLRVNEIYSMVQINFGNEAYSNIVPQYMIQKVIKEKFEEVQSITEYDLYQLAIEAKLSDKRSIQSV